jgi:uncharacterized protein involved in exopolysaccharide biosynthesis
MELQHSASVGEYVAVLRRRRLLMVVFALPIILVAGILAVALPDVYRSSATFRLVTDDIAKTLGESGEYADQYVLGLADRVLDSDNLEPLVSEVKPYPELEDDQSAAIAELRDNVAVEMTTETSIEGGGLGREHSVNTGFVVSYDNQSPEKAQLVAAGLAKIFLDLSRKERLVSAANTVKFFAGEAERTSKDIAEYEQQLAEFKERNFEQLPETAQANIGIRARVEQELDSVDLQIRNLQQNRVFVTQQLAQAQAGPTANNLRALEDEYARKAAVYAEDHPDVVALRRQIESLRAVGPSTGGNTLQAQLDSQRAALAEARQRYSEDHPDIRRMQRNIESLEARLAAGESPRTNVLGESLLAVQLQTQANALDTQLAGLQGRSAELHRRLDQFESRLGSTPEVERKYQEISRGLGTARQKFDQMVGKRMDAEVEAAAISGGTADRFRVEWPPGKPGRPVSPKRFAIVVIAIILAFIVAFSAAVLAEVLDSRVRGSADLRRTLGHAPLAVVPEIHNTVYWRLRSRRILMLGASTLGAIPIIYLIVHLLAN